MKSRQYFKNIITNKTHYIDVCCCNYDESIEYLKGFAKDFTNDVGILALFIHNSAIDVSKYIESDEKLNEIKNNILLYSFNGYDIKPCISIINCTATNTDTSKYTIITEKQTIFNITKQVLREKKLKRILK